MVIDRTLKYCEKNGNQKNEKITTGTVKRQKKDQKKSKKNIGLVFNQITM